MCRRRGAGAPVGLPAAVLAVLVAAFPAICAADPAPLAPEADYDPAIPSPGAVLGHDPGAALTDYPQLERYLAALSAAPTVRVTRYGASVERRSLYLLLIASPENLARSEEIRGRIAKLADPRRIGSAEEAERIIRETPAVVWLNYGNDGNETAAFEAAIQVAYHLAADRSPATQALRRDLLVVLTPCLNPESHERMVAWYRAFAQEGGNPDPLAYEHHAPWGMSTNYNHYQVDLNRDSTFGTQPETRAFVAEYLKWRPQVFVDHHGETGSYFFPPFAAPLNANMGSRLPEWLRLYGEGLAEAFALRGWTFFSRESFDDFYPGYWDAFPNLSGAVGMTYETDGGGDDGLRLEGTDGTLRTLEEAARRHAVASLATLEITRQHRERRLRDFHAFHRESVEEGRTGRVKAYLLPDRGDRDRLRILLQTLLRDGVEVKRTSEPLRAGRIVASGETTRRATTFPPGTFVVDLAQPAGRMARALMESDPALDPRFLEEEREKRKRKEPDAFYDVTAWSLPLALGVEAYESEERMALPGQSLAEVPKIGEIPPEASPRYAYLIPGDRDAGLRLTTRLLAEGYRLGLANRSFRNGSTTYSRGTAIARVDRNLPSLQKRIARLSRELDLAPGGADTSLTEEGITLGSPRILDLELPRIAVLTGPATDENSYGSIWFLLERDYGLPFTPVSAETLRKASLRRFDVLVFPHGKGYGDHLGDDFRDRLQAWVSAGGVAVGIAGGSEYLASTGSDLTRTRFRGEAVEEDDHGGEQPEKLPRTPGAILRVDLDDHLPLTAGYGSSAPVLVHSRRQMISEESDGETLWIAGRFAGKERIRLGGFLWPESREALAGAAYLVEEKVEAGRIVLFAEDPNFRLQWRGLSRLFLNSLLLPAAQVRRSERSGGGPDTP